MVHRGKRRNHRGRQSHDHDLSLHCRPGHPQPNDQTNPGKLDGQHQRPPGEARGPVRTEPGSENRQAHEGHDRQKRGQPQHHDASPLKQPTGTGHRPERLDRQCRPPLKLTQLHQELPRENENDSPHDNRQDAAGHAASRPAKARLRSSRRRGRTSPTASNRSPETASRRPSGEHRPTPIAGTSATARSNHQSCKRYHQYSPRSAALISRARFAVSARIAEKENPQEKGCMTEMNRNCARQG